MPPVSSLCGEKLLPLDTDCAPNARMMRSDGTLS
jgi:hypothetical protein